MLLVLGLVLFAAGLVVALQTAMRPRTERQASLRRVTHYTVEQEAHRGRPEERQSLVEALVPTLSRIALKLTPRVQRDELQVRLTAAGLSSRLSAQQFLAVKTVLGFLGIVFALAIGGATPRGFLLALLLLGASIVLPDFALRRRALARAERLTADLPEAIDQIVVSLEAGLSFDGAVSFFVRRGRTQLAGELRVMLSEIRMGESRVEALKGLAERVPSPEMRNFVQTLVQSEGVGMSRAAILSDQAADVRHRRQLAAEELAQKAPIKMLFPIVIFILPVMFVIILGPAFQQATRLLGP